MRIGKSKSVVFWVARTACQSVVFWGYLSRCEV
jgi:hypothetical protein